MQAKASLRFRCDYLCKQKAVMAEGKVEDGPLKPLRNMRKSNITIRS